MCSFFAIHRGKYARNSGSKVEDHLKEHFNYLRLAKIIRQTLSTCDSFQRNKIATMASPINQESVQPEKPLELLSIDFFGPLVKAK